jgi:small-conductance mechanosensitive channel
MDTTKVILTLVVIAIYILPRILINRSIDRTVLNSSTKKARSKVLKKVIRMTILSICIAIILIIWGVDQEDIAVFIGSVLTVVGIALFAQWSILSNITSGVIVFFNHSVKLDDTIVIIDKDYEIEGRVSDIGLFFVILKTKEGEQISVPSNVFIQKMIKKKLTP